MFVFRIVSCVFIWSIRKHRALSFSFRIYLLCIVFRVRPKKKDQIPIVSHVCYSTFVSVLAGKLFARKVNENGRSDPESMWGKLVDWKLSLWSDEQVWFRHSTTISHWPTNNWFTIILMSVLAAYGLTSGSIFVFHLWPISDRLIIILVPALTKDSFSVSLFLRSIDLTLSI